MSEPVNSSSGLVAVAWIAPTSYEWPAHFISTSEIRNGEPLVRLSDAEAIISKLSSKDRYGVCDECGTPYSFDPTDGGTICIKCQKDKIAQKDAEILEQCRINGMGAERELALLGQIERQSAALKLAREALERSSKRDIAQWHNWDFDGDDDGKPPTQLNDPVLQAQLQALAAIDALKGE